MAQYYLRNCTNVITGKINGVAPVNSGRNKESDQRYFLFLKAGRIKS